MPVPAYFLAQAIRIKADARAHGEILRLLDDTMAVVRGPAQIAQRARSARMISVSMGTDRYIYPLFLTRDRALTSFDYPAPGASSITARSCCCATSLNSSSAMIS